MHWNRFSLVLLYVVVTVSYLFYFYHDSFSLHRATVRIFSRKSGIPAQGATTAATAQTKPNPDAPIYLLTILCKGRCNGNDCLEYITPLNECYNGQHLFPNDRSWGNVYIVDELLIRNTGAKYNTETSKVSLKRTIYKKITRNNTGVDGDNNVGDNGDVAVVSSLSSCHDGTNGTDVFQLPMNECVGPFGKPRPWGMFLIASNYSLNMYE